MFTRLYSFTGTCLGCKLLCAALGLVLLVACQRVDELEAPATATPVEAPTLSPTPQSRANADVLRVRAVQGANDTWIFHVTIEHPDRGWEDYADGWDVLTPDGTVLKSNPEDPFTRLLLHPHVDEQPFTRSQSGIAIPQGVTVVRVRAHDLLDGYGGREVTVDLATDVGPGFEVERKASE